ncbi:MAG TPA: tripartite tricarboxylate transporter substrate-binding protein [Alphaproteobacteria bacterium]
MASTAFAGEFYKGKQIDVVIGSTPGGGFDSYARFLSRHMYRHIPGNPTMVPKNMPGAGGLKQMTYLMGAAPTDGTVIGIINPVMTTAPLLTPEVAKFDPLRYEWIGSANAEISTCGFWKHSGVNGVEDLTKRELIIGGVGPSSGSTMDAMTLKNVLGLPFKIVPGYSGLSEVALAAARGEVDGACGLNVTTLKSAHWDAIQRGELKIVVQTSLRSHPDLPGVANVFSLAKTEEQKEIMQLTFGPWIYGRPFVAPPGTDPKQLAVLRAAFAETMKDPQFLTEADKAHLEVNPATPEEIVVLIKNIYATPPAVIEKTRQMLNVAERI